MRLPYGVTRRTTTGFPDEVASFPVFSMGSCIGMGLGGLNGGNLLFLPFRNVGGELIY